MHRNVLSLALLAAAAACTLPAAAADALPKGTVIVAKTAPEALLVWDASPAVADLVQAKTAEPDGLHALESDALQILAARAASLRAKRVQLRVVYTRSGAVSAVYNAATFAGVERVMVLSAARDDIASHAAAWQAAARTGAATPGLTVTVSGKLPPPG